jgi:hypothetical protein
MMVLTIEDIIVLKLEDYSSEDIIVPTLGIIMVLTMKDIIVLELGDHDGPHHGGHYCPCIRNPYHEGHYYPHIIGPYWSSPWRTDDSNLLIY